MEQRIIGDWVIREKMPDGFGSFHVLLMLHGWTGDENSMEIFTKGLPGNYWMAAPRGIYASAPGGYSWYSDQEKTWPWMDDFRPAMEALFELLTPEVFPGAELEQIDVMGFSQGAALAYALAFLTPQRVRNIIGLAGFMPEGGEALARNKPLSGKRIFVAHGSLDKLVPVEKGRTCVSVLKSAGGEVTYCEDEVGHKLSKGCSAQLRRFLGTGV